MPRKATKAAWVVVALTAAVVPFLTHTRAAAAPPVPVLYVSNFNSDEVTVYDARKGTYLGIMIRGRGELRGANGIAVGPDGDIYVAGQFSNNIVRYDGKTGRFKAVLDPENQAGIASPQGLNFGPDGLLYAASYDNDKIVTYNTERNAFVRPFTEIKAAAAKHMGPQGPFFGPDGSLFIGNFTGSSTMKYRGPELANQPAERRVAGEPGALLTTFEGVPQALLARVGAGGSAFASGVVSLGAEVERAAEAGGAVAAAPAAAARTQAFVYIDHIDPKGFTGEVLQYTTDGKFVKEFVPFKTAGLELTGGIDIGPDKNLYVANVKVNRQFQDEGSTIMRFDIKSGKFLNVFVPAGKGLAVPFAMCFSNRSTPVPKLAH